MRLQFVQKTLGVVQSLYRTAFGDSLVLSPGMGDDGTPAIPELQWDGGFDCSAYKRMPHTSRTVPNSHDPEYPVSLGAHLKVPLSSRLPITLEVLNPIDEAEVGNSVKYWIDHRPLQITGPLVQSVNDYVAHYIPADISDADLTGQIRALQLHMREAGVSADNLNAQVSGKRAAALRFSD